MNRTQATTPTVRDLPHIAVLGLGAMGSRMARRLLDAGHDVTVWNRTPAAAQDLVERGATLASTPRAAAAAADVVLSMVRDDAASRLVWLASGSGALAAMQPHAVALECSTVSAEHVERLHAEFADAERRLLDAPVAGSRPQAEAGQLIFLVGGDEQDLATVRPLLEVLGGAVHHAGAAGAGSLVKLVVNGLFAAQLAAIAEWIAALQARGADVERLWSLVAATPVCSRAARVSGEAMLAGSWQPAFPIELVAKDMGLLLAAAVEPGALPVSEAVAAVYRSAVERGFGGDNITGVRQLYG